VIVGVVGAGTMGAGIAQVALEHDDEVVLHDIDPAAIDRARAQVRDGLGRRARGLDPDGETAASWVDSRLEGLRVATTLDAVAGEAHVVIEAVLEDLGLKQEVLRALDAGAPPDVVLATNTSALSVAAIAAATARPARVVGFHCFNPVPRMALVEVAPGPATNAEVVERALAIARSWGKTPVRVLDRPGFIVNRVHRPFTIEALRLVEAGEASIEAVDAAMRDDGFRLGPFELMDLIGIDVNLAVARAIWEGLGRPDRLRPSPLQEQLVEGGRLGRKTGVGFYRYEHGQATGPAQAATGTTAGAVAAGPDAIRARIRTALVQEAHIALDEGLASANDVDLALRLGAGHPRPLLGVADDGQEL
jgi:3-hydroxybutyryl-CoA dehydrogenase